MKTYRKYKVIRRVEESNLVVSLYLAPVDDIPLTQFMPGQHLMFKLHIPGQEIPVFRYYSFSDLFNPYYYRISVKKELPPVNDLTLPEGLVSSYIYDRINEGDILEAKGPSGDFFLNPEDGNPVVLIAGGIGITPLLSMVKSIAISNPRKKAYFFYGVNERSDHAFHQELQDICTKHDNICITTFYTKVKLGDIRELHYDYVGYINLHTILQITRETHLNYYICGPGGMMTCITEGLEKLGVNKDNIHVESFNNKDNQEPEEVSNELPRNEDGPKIDTEFSVEFSISGKKMRWDNRYKSILEFAEGNDIDINSGCLFGDCGTCLTEIEEGDVHYMHKTLVTVENGKCLPCSCVPVSNLVLKA